jgi:hypothetical protein
MQDICNINFDLHFKIIYLYTHRVFFTIFLVCISLEMKKLLVVSALFAFPIALVGCGTKEPEVDLTGIENEANIRVEDLIVSEEDLTDETINEVEGLVDEVENNIEDSTGTEEIQTGDAEVVGEVELAPMQESIIE